MDLRIALGQAARRARSIWPQLAGAAILHGNGRAFAAGADIEHYVSLSVSECAAFVRAGNAVQQQLTDCPAPIIAAVHGYALGGGLELAQCCDLIVAEPTARLGLPEATLGLLPGGGGTQRLPRLVGTVRAAGLLMTGRRLSGGDAVSWGLALGLGDAPTALAAAEALAGRIVAMAPLAVQMAMIVLRGGDAPISVGLSLEQAVGRDAVRDERCSRGHHRLCGEAPGALQRAMTAEPAVGAAGGGEPAMPVERAERPEWLTDRGRAVFGTTPPGQSTPCARESALDDGELAEVVELIAAGRLERRSVVLPERLWTRHWPSVQRVGLALDERLGREGSDWEGCGWKIGAAAGDIRRAEKVPGPSPGRVYRRGVTASPAVLGRELFINYRCCECEFAFELGRDFPVRDEPYDEDDVRAGIASLFPALEIGDTVFEDWYGASGYFGSCLDNGGGAALVEGKRLVNWAELDEGLPSAGIDVYLEGRYVKSGTGVAAMGHPVTSLTWLLNWLREHGRAVEAGEVVSTGTCTGHLFASPGDSVRADFGVLGVVEARFA